MLSCTAGGVRADTSRFISCFFSFVLQRHRTPQEMQPRAYFPAPIRINFFGTSYSRNSGGLLFDPSLPVEVLTSMPMSALSSWVSPSACWGALRRTEHRKWRGKVGLPGQFASRGQSWGGDYAASISQGQLFQRRHSARNFG